MLPKEPEDNPLDGTTIGYIRRIPDNMDPGHNGPHAKELKRLAVKALKRPYKDPNPMVEKPCKESYLSSSKWKGRAFALLLNDLTWMSV